MNGFGGAGAFSDGKYNLTNEFGGTLYEYIGKQKAMELMHYVDDINVACGGAGTKLYSTADSGFKQLCLQNNLHLLDASVRHLGTDINYKVLENLYAKLKDHVDFHFLTPVKALSITEDGAYVAETDKGAFTGRKCIISVGRSGSKWMESVCQSLDIPTKSNRVDIGVRVELPAEVFAPITDELYESKIVYKTEKYQDQGAHLLHEPQGRGGQREHQRHRHRQRPQLRGPRHAHGEHQLRPAGIQTLHRAVPGQPTATARASRA